MSKIKNKEIFSIKNNEMLFWRLGAMSSQKQKHFGKDGHQPPVSRGLWCFPHPFHDLFFAYHQWESKLPKKFRKTPDWDKITNEEAELYHKEKEEAIKKVKKLLKPKTFWYGGKFYSHISLHGKSDYGRWYLWDSVTAWADEARKHIYTTEKFGDTVWTGKYSSDHLEIFIPNFK